MSKTSLLVTLLAIVLLVVSVILIVQFLEIIDIEEYDVASNWGNLRPDQLLKAVFIEAAKLLVPCQPVSLFD